ncbi:hypothetical protein, variant [Verruconis gallopava]|uniref:Zn(2)-C6 fungal-type domain-containing protein n=1 Tax=Verruconis gallopava TaxID=253628 RepID=A0A0D2A9Q6_9PEZI|nr:uncharacterized protein PV09_05237 [Verruconis gallopava]XP_016213338.1 hypothetical protein, variant [Verruconis gallopava]KIW03468.1 hypothetical protein PV09_05237 [Verruconis gallopava]KIW03469.1 hypothetical protein, variant [Verruconis gallopava]
MDVRNLLTAETQSPQSRQPQPSVETEHSQQHNLQGKAMNAAHGHSHQAVAQPTQRNATNRAAENPYTTGGPPKSVAFELILPEAPQQRARLPMRVNIYPHDATDSIVTTVKNFYGLYDGNGVSFEDKEGNTLIARYENFQNRMTVYVRVTEEYSAAGGTPRPSLSPKRPHLGPPFEMGNPIQDEAYGNSRPSSRTARPRSQSPSARGRRSVSVSTNPKSRSRANAKSRTGSTQGSFADGQFDRDMSDSDGGNASVTSSRRGKVAEVVSADISVENIVEGGRRKRAPFDSSELPLFVPSQMPTSVSSVSPQRRIGQPNFGSPYQYSNQQSFSYQQPLPSPQSKGYSDGQAGHPGATTPGYGNRELRQRQTTYSSTRYSTGNGVLPTPDPTIGSVISDEDVAIQLMRLGEASNFSSHGRTSTSTLDDALSGKAEASDYSDGSDADDEDLPRAGYASDEYSGEELDDRHDVSHDGIADSHGPVNVHPNKLIKTQFNGDKRDGSAPRKLAKPPQPKKKKSLESTKAPMSPTSLPAQSRKASIASLTYGPDEEDLSAKPRCQRCRKSKKGCDRQRPCGRCRDAGIGIEGCISEDEGNGRKGRYGRHMGVPIKKEVPTTVADLQPAIPQVVAHQQTHTQAHQHLPMGPPSLIGVNQKKRKR